MTGKLTADQRAALDTARHLAEYGVPIFIAKPARKNGQWDPTGGHGGTGYVLPARWQETTPRPSVVDEWQPGDALCAVMGHAVDGLDVDPRHGGEGSIAEMNGMLPRVYGRQTTPSGGTHDLIASLGVRSMDGVRPGVDVKAGHRGEGHGCLFIAPTQRLSKTGSVIGEYRWVKEPGLGALDTSDDSGAALADEIRLKQYGGLWDGPDYDGPEYEELSRGEQQLVDQHVQGVEAFWRDRLAEAEYWHERDRDEQSRGWEALARDAAWALARLAVTPWAGVDEDSARQTYDRLLPEAIAQDPKCAGKWHDGLIAKAASEPVEPPPWETLRTPPEKQQRPFVDVTNQSDASAWLREEIGRGGLAGLFRKNELIVHTPRVGENGYVPPKGNQDYDGPAQVQPVDATGLAARVDLRYAVFKSARDKFTATLFPIEPARRAVSPSMIGDLPNVRDLLGVTHTPVVRADGSIVDEPGYDLASGLLYLPDPELVVPPVPVEPSEREVAGAGALLLEMIQDFPFETPHDRANYLGALLTPLLRPLVAPPYKMLAIGAPERGSGKGLLAAVLRAIHGGVFKSEMPSSDDELRKVVTTLLDTTAAPVIQFDNVEGVLRSSTLAGLLTTPTWSDRILGQSKLARELRNDRLWVITGNNVVIGGDMERRLLWVTIDAKMPQPETRTDFHITNLEGWVQERRSALIHALLTLIRSWVVAGKPVGALETTDNFGPWVQTLNGILSHAALGDEVGQVGHLETARESVDLDKDEYATFLAAVHDEYGSAHWTAKDVVGKFLADDGVLPERVADKLHRGGSATRVLGRWLLRHDRSWAGDMSVQKGDDGRDGHLWRVVRL